MYVTTCCIPGGSRDKRSVPCCSGALNVCLGNGGEGFASSREPTGQVCWERLVGVSKVDLKPPRIWWWFSHLPVSPAFTGVFLHVKRMRNPTWAELKWKRPCVCNTGCGEYLIFFFFFFWDRHPFFLPLWNLYVSRYIDISFTRENVFLYEEDTQRLLVAFLPLFLAAVSSGDDDEHCPVFHPPQGSWTWARRFRHGGALEGKKTTLNAAKEWAWEKAE